MKQLVCECKPCRYCGGVGEVKWYLGDEFNSQGYGACDSCEGTGVDHDDCPLCNATPEEIQAAMQADAARESEAGK